MRLSAPQHVRSDGENRRGIWSRTLRYWLEPVYYWWDLRDYRGRPDHGKILSSVAFFFGLTGLAYFGPIVAQMCRTAQAGCATALGFFLAYSVLVFAMAFGLAGFRAYVKYRGGGTAEGFTQIATTEAKLAAEIVERRKQGGDYEVTP